MISTTVLATVFGVLSGMIAAIVGLSGNLDCIACRWANALWLGTVSAACFVLAYHPQWIS